MNLQTQLAEALKRALEANPERLYEHMFGSSKNCICWRCEAESALESFDSQCPACGESPCAHPCDACGAPCSEDHRNCNPVSRWEESSRYEGSPEASDDMAKIWPDAHYSYATVQIGDGPVTDIEVYLAKTARNL